MELTRNQKVAGISLAGVVAWLLYRKRVKLQSHRAETPAGPTQVVVPVPTGAGTGAIANVLGNVLPSAHADLVSRALSQTPLVIQAGNMAPTKISTIADIQHALNFLKVCGPNSQLRVSGVLDPPTIACLKAFQSVTQIPITGMDDPTTRMTLESSVVKSAISVAAPAILATPAVIAPPTVNPVIQTERDLQRGLNVLGASPKLKEDGKIGPITTAAIKAFQVIHGLAADGLAGPQTKATIATAMQWGAVPPPPAPLASGDNFGFIPPPFAHREHSGLPAPPLPTGATIPGFVSRGGFRNDGFNEFHNDPWNHPNYVPPPPPPGGYAPESFSSYVAPPSSYIAPPVTNSAAPNLFQPAPPLTNTSQGPGGLNTRQRWFQIHPSGRDKYNTDYHTWWQQHGQYGAQINGEGDFSGRGRGRRKHSNAGGGGAVDDDSDDVCVEMSGEEIVDMESKAMVAAHGMRDWFASKGDRRFESDHYGVPGGADHRGWFDRVRSLFPWWKEYAAVTQSGVPVPTTVDQNPYIPPPATPPVMNWDPFATTAPAVERWNTDDLRRREELERRGYARLPGEVVDHASPPGPPIRR
jgi:putative peptidoglycan binding protein